MTHFHIKRIILPKPVWDPSHVKNNQVGGSLMPSQRLRQIIDHFCSTRRGRDAVGWQQGCRGSGTSGPHFQSRKADVTLAQIHPTGTHSFRSYRQQVDSFPNLSGMTNYPEAWLEEFGGKTKHKTHKNPPPFPSHPTSTARGSPFGFTREGGARARGISAQPRAPRVAFRRSDILHRFFFFFFFSPC